MRTGSLPLWARAYVLYDAHMPHHPGKGRLLATLARTGARREEPLLLTLLNGNKIYVSPHEGEIVDQTVGMTCLRTGGFEPRVELAIREFLKPGDTAVDVGANIGYMTGVMAQEVGSTGRVIAVEPAPANLELLRRTLAVNGYDSIVEVAPTAVGDEIGEVTLLFDRRLPGNASMHYAETHEEERISVPITKLDEILCGDYPALMKIDVQGHEMAVFRGAEQVIRNGRPILIFEYDPTAASPAGWTLSDATELLTSMAPYEFFRLTDRGREPVDSLRRLQGRAYGDVIAIPILQPSKSPRGS